MKIPVVVISKTINPCPELKLVVNQAKAWNSDVFLLGDEGNQDYCPDNHKFMSEYYEGVEDFENLYQHLSTNPQDIEKFCFSRWFILRNFLRKEGYKGAFYIDNDILLFTDVSVEYEKRKHLYCMLSGKTSGHSSYWSIEGIEAFCDYLMEIYSNKDSYDFARLASHYHVRQQHGLYGGLCDMTLLESFGRYRYPHMVGEGSVANPMSKEPYYDHVIQEDEGFEHENGRKKFIITDGIPYSKYLSTGTYIPFATVHFQGANKPLMAPFIKECNDTLI
jgi:hypothetical protein